MKKKRYTVEYTRYKRNTNILSIEEEKILFSTNSYMLAKFYFKDRCRLFIDYIKSDINVEVLIYDNLKYRCVCRNNYYFTKDVKE